MVSDGEDGLEIEALGKAGAGRIALLKLRRAGGLRAAPAQRNEILDRVVGWQ
jgi:hypothetical protein